MVAVAEAAPLTVSEKVPLGTPVPVSGMVSAGAVVLGLVAVRVPLRGPRVVGVKVTVIWQLVPGVERGGGARHGDGVVAGEGEGEAGDGGGAGVGEGEGLGGGGADGDVAEVECGGDGLEV